MQVTVPQFIDVESKIIGPISARQFIILIVGFFLEYLLYTFGATTTLLIGTPLILGPTLLLAFVKINGQLFHLFLLNFFITIKRPKLRLWEKEGEITADIHSPVSVQRYIPKPMPRRSRLRELSLIVDTGGAYAVEQKEISRFHPQKKVQTTHDNDRSQ